VPIDQNVTAPAAVPATASAIENEIAAYRAISPMAVVALILGVLSILSFASPYFLALPVLAAATAVLADRKIQRMPDILTGRGLAQAGLALGLACGLTAVAVTTVQSVLRANQAKTFARTYERVLKKGKLDEILWYGQPPAIRVQYTPEQLAKETIKDRTTAQMAEEKNGPYKKFLKALAEPGADFHFGQIETHGEDGLQLFAAAQFEIHTPNAAEPDLKEQYAVAVMKATKTDKGRYEWWVEDFRFPYKPSTFVAPAPKAVDDGHGHAH